MSAKHILVVEDEEKITRLLCDYLKQAGFRTASQDNGDRVIAQVKKEPPDLILLDIMLPGKDGMALCREIRQFSNVPIIMITALDGTEDKVCGLECGADEFLSKPVNSAELLARVKSMLRLKQYQEQLQVRTRSQKTFSENAGAAPVASTRSPVRNRKKPASRRRCEERSKVSIPPMPEPMITPALNGSATCLMSACSIACTAAAMPS